MDFFTVVTLRFRKLHVFLVLEHERRGVGYFAVTEHPHVEWVVQQLREATPFGEHPKYLLGDNGGIHGDGVPRSWRSTGIARSG